MSGVYVHLADTLAVVQTVADPRRPVTELLLCSRRVAAARRTLGVTVVTGDAAVT